jgi:hypothetical protein
VEIETNGKRKGGRPLNLHALDQMEDWEKELDNIDWKTMLADIDRALMDNLAAELGFPSYQRLEQASERVVEDFYVAHLSDGRWVWWNPTTYAKEDPLYFENKQQIMEFIAKILKLEKKHLKRLEQGLDQVVQTKRCRCCEHEYNPFDPSRIDWDAEQEQAEFCSPECAMEYVMDEMKEDFTG